MTQPSLFPAEVGFELMDPSTASIADLSTEESALVSSAVDTRQREFAAGRLCAHRAMNRLGVASTPLLARPDRSPAWPPEIVGSISHTRGVCGAAIARRGPIAGLGFDVEPAEPLPPNVWSAVLTAAELAEFSQLADAERPVLGRLAFSVKEAFYKCYHSAGGGWLDFHDLEVRITADTVEVKSVAPLWERPRRVHGKYAVGDYIAVGVVAYD